MTVPSTGNWHFPKEETIYVLRRGFSRATYIYEFRQGFSQATYKEIPLDTTYGVWMCKLTVPSTGNWHFSPRKLFSRNTPPRSPEMPLDTTYGVWMCKMTVPSTGNWHFSPTYKFSPNTPPRSPEIPLDTTYTPSKKYPDDLPISSIKRLF